MTPEGLRKRLAKIAAKRNSLERLHRDALRWRALRLWAADCLGACDVCAEMRGGLYFACSDTPRYNFSFPTAREIDRIVAHYTKAGKL